MEIAWIGYGRMGSLIDEVACSQGHDVVVSTNGGVSWTPRNDDLPITGFQSLGSSPLTGAVIGASQDNAGQLWTGSRRWTHLSCCGDGGYSFLDFDNAMILYAGSNFGDLRRSTGATDAGWNARRHCVTAVRSQAVLSR